MKEIIFCNSLDKLRKILTKKGNNITYLILQYDRESAKIEKFLKDSGCTGGNCTSKKYTENFQEKFVDFVARLNKNNYSFLWWGLNFTNKNPITTQLCNKIFNFLKVVSLLEENNFQSLIVITTDKEIFYQLKIYTRDKPIKIINAIRIKPSIKNIAKQFSPLAVFFAFFRRFLFRLYARSYYKIKFEKDKGYIVVLSLLNHQSFTKEGNYRDTYFGDFPSYLKEKGVGFINLLIVITPNYKQIIRRAQLHSLGMPIAPVECFLKLSDLLVCLVHSLIKYFLPHPVRGNTEIEGVNVGYLVRKVIKNDVISSYFYDNLRIYYAVKSLIRMVKVDRFYYPFENRSFEKMIILALRKFSPQTKIIGYQHASISLRHTNFLLGKDEYKITPLPDVILTMGEITREIMRDSGNFPENLLRVGCALRQKPYQGQLKKKRIISNILVALATNIEEYVKVLHFLNAAFEENNSYHIWIRPHPVFSLEKAIKITGQPRFRFHKADKETLEECYDWSDVVIYVHSTLSIEAIMRGIPVININIGEPLNPDPLFNFDDFKWRTESPQELIPTIKKINLIEESEFKLRQERAKAYAQRYIIKVDGSKLEDFLNVR